MPLSTQPYKGARDFYPEDKRLQKYMFSVLRTVAERFGYEEYDAPLIEPTELYASKTSEEIVSEQTYSFIDRGDRSVTIRTEMTPSVSRMVAGKRQELAYPLRWYSIPNLWRYERPQRGRLREFWQFNADVFGLPGIDAELEMIQLSDAIMQTFGAKRDMYTIRINSRAFLQDMLSQVLGFDDTQITTLMRLIDRMHKTDPAQFQGLLEAVLSPTQRESDTLSHLQTLLACGSIDEIPPHYTDHPSVVLLKRLITMLDSAGVTNVKFDITLMRGFDYYTDIVFEVFDNDEGNNRSMFGGGRYDGLVGLFGVEEVPTVGFGMGDVTLQNFLESHGLMPELKPETEVYVALIGDVFDRSQKVIANLREMGLNVFVDSSGRKPDKQLKTAIRKKVPYVLFVGEDELRDEQFMLKHLQSAKEERHSLQRVVSIIKDYRNG